MRISSMRNEILHPTKNRGFRRPLISVHSQIINRSPNKPKNSPAISPKKVYAHKAESPSLCCPCPSIVWKLLLAAVHSVVSPKLQRSVAANSKFDGVDKTEQKKKSSHLRFSICDVFSRLFSAGFCKCTCILSMTGFTKSSFSLIYRRYCCPAYSGEFGEYKAISTNGITTSQLVH